MIKSCKDHYSSNSNPRSFVYGWGKLLGPFLKKEKINIVQLPKLNKYTSTYFPILRFS